MELLSTTVPKCPSPSGWPALALGSRPDEVVARELVAAGLPVARSTITRARQALGIPTYARPPAPPRPPKRRSRIDWDALPLGVVFDALLAKHLGLTHPAVLYHRTRRNLPVAPRSLDNLLLSLAQRRPDGILLRRAVVLLHSPPDLVRSAAVSLRSLGLASIRDGRVVPILVPSKPKSRSKGVSKLPSTSFMGPKTDPEGVWIPAPASFEPSSAVSGVLLL